MKNLKNHLFALEIPNTQTMKMLKVFSLVIVLHMAIFAMVVLPGCNSVSKTDTSKAATPVGTDSRFSDLWQVNDAKTSASGTAVANTPMRHAQPQSGGALIPPPAANRRSAEAPMIEIKRSEASVPTVYADANEHFEYTVARGDSIWTISRKHNISMRALMQYNGINESDRLQPGQMMMIPGKEPAGIAAPVSIASNETKAPVKPVAVKKPVTPAPLVASIESRPVAASSSTTNDAGVYEVKPGDSLYILAMQNNVSVEEIKRVNQLNSNIIRVGQSLHIPGLSSGVVEITPSSSFAQAFNDIPVNISASSDEKNYLEHEVAPGEFPGLIARKYNMSVADLLHLNDIRNPRSLQVGTKLKVWNPEHATRGDAGNQDAESKVEEAVARGNTEPAAAPRANQNLTVDDFPVIRIGS